MTDTNIENLERQNPLLHKIQLAFEDPDPEVVERLKDKPQWIQRQAGGRVHIIPAQEDKHSMLGLFTNDSELYEVFNEAAKEVTQQWDGFWQVGSSAREGLSAWEMWKKPDITEEELLRQTEAQMIHIANNNPKW